MINDALFGPAFPDQGWVPAPRYLMRRARILDMARDLAPGRLLETGPGAATLLIEFAARGFRCEALELSEGAREFARDLIATSGQDVRIHGAAQPGWEERFDCLFSFDVLEHIGDDAGALRAWAGWLKPGGVLLLSVPARMKLWTAGDEWAGHYRRYERDQLIELLRASGFEIDEFDCYGFPLTNITERASAAAYRKLIHRQEASIERNRQANNDRSGIDRRPHLRLYPLLKSLPGRLAIRFFLATQKLFLGLDWGSGYIVRARKK
jgi:SAM-dependent methyltransferase